jgi:hypothetical protein
MSKFDFVSVGGQSLRPAPYVSTTYEYNKFGEYTIGGFLIVTLSGTLVGADIISQIATLNQKQTNSNCIDLTIGCSGKDDFLKGSGRIRSIDISPSDQPFTASYSMQIAIETIGNNPAVPPDEQFLKNHSLKGIRYLQSYNESITVQGEGTSLGNNDLGLSKSYIKASGQISVTSFGREICGDPQFNGLKQSLDIVQQRAESLLSLNPYQLNSGSTLNSFVEWEKWLDSKKLDIDTATGAVTWSFDLYLSNGKCEPSAWADITTEDKYDHKRRMRTKTINGTIKGLSSFTGDFLGNKATANERMSNAESAFDKIDALIVNGTWPGGHVILAGTLGICTKPDPCDPQNQTCYQRISSNLTKSVVSGEISFSAEFGDVSLCKNTTAGIGSVEVSVEVSQASDRIVEIIVPNGVNAIVQKIGDTPARATITSKGTLSVCDRTKMNQLKGCVQTELTKKVAQFNGWILLKEKKSAGTYSYSETREYIQCG